MLWVIMNIINNNDEKDNNKRAKSRYYNIKQYK